MEKPLKGMSIYVTPQADGDHKIYVNANEWIGDRCTKVDQLFGRTVSLAGKADDYSEIGHWILDVIEVVSQVAQRQLLPQPPKRVSGSNPYSQDTTGNASLPF